MALTSHVHQKKQKQPAGTQMCFCSDLESAGIHSVRKNSFVPLLSAQFPFPTPCNCRHALRTGEGAGGRQVARGGRWCGEAGRRHREAGRWHREAGGAGRQAGGEAGRRRREAGS